ncbi:MAG: GntR family transcriptional regulator [Acidimicrobiia bacterium]
MTPIYRSAADELEARISGWTPGTRVPSEDELARELGISRLTARAVLQELERRWVVRRRQGLGTFAARRIDYVISRQMPPSWSESVRRAGRRPSIATTSLQLAAAPAEIRRALRLSSRRRLLLLTRQRYVDNELVGLADSWLDPLVVPDLDRVLAPEASLHAVLDRHYRLAPVRGWFRVGLDPAPVEVAGRLGHTGRPLVVAIRSRTDAAALAHRPVELTISWLRADVFRVEVELDGGT